MELWFWGENETFISVCPAGQILCVICLLGGNGEGFVL